MQAKRFNDNFRKRKRLLTTKKLLETEDWKKLLLEDVQVFDDEKLCEECQAKKTDIGKKNMVWCV